MAPTGYISAITPENSTQLAITEVSPGQILLTTNFAAELPDVTPVSVPDGLMAIAINLGDVQRVGNFLRPGSEVVIFNSYTSGGGRAVEGGAATGDLTTRVLVDRALILGVGETASVAATNPDGTTAAPLASSLITMAVDQTEAEKSSRSRRPEPLHRTSSVTAPRSSRATAPLMAICSTIGDRTCLLY